jgi:uncharacterized protein with GYD domain
LLNLAPQTEEGGIMPLYMVQASYTPQAVAAMTKSPQDRTQAIRPLIEGVGGQLRDVFFCQGDYDIIALAELPDAEAANAVALAAIGAGHLKAYKTTPLFTGEEAMGAMRRAAELTIRPPS